MPPANIISLSPPSPQPLATAPVDSITSEEILARKYDRALSNFLVKSSVGASVGIALSFLFFRRRTWPIALGTGAGLGIAYEQCARSFNPYTPSSSAFRTA
ncbi:hypothetical protein HDU89_000442 [Geranomyces variabilis]|nr:hypothetical protein HDU89_000442 [Geranomyces variabilis]